MSENKTGLSPYDEAATCPKCGHGDVTTGHCTGEMPGQRCWGTTAKATPKGEHLHRHCVRCHYEWFEACVVGQPAEPERDVETVKRCLADISTSAKLDVWARQRVNKAKQPLIDLLHDAYERGKAEEREACFQIAVDDGMLEPHDFFCKYGVVTSNEAINNRGKRG